MNQKRKHTNLRLVTRVVAGVLLAGALPASQAQSLIHRWSFNNATDSVGSATVSLTGGATISGGALHVNGASGAGSFGSVNVTADFAANSSITIEGWFTTAVVQNWSKVWMFGNGGANANVGTSYLDFTPNRGDNLNPGISIKPLSSNGDFAYEASGNHINAGVEVHAVATYNYPANTITLYINGVAVISGGMQSTAISALQANQFRFGAGTSWGDPSFNGSIDEMRLIGGVLSVPDILIDTAVGPNTALTNYTPVSVSVNTPAPSMAGGATQQATVLANFAQISGVNVPGAVTNWSSSNPAVLKVSSTGLVSAVGAGNATVSATINGTTGTSTSIAVSAVQPTIPQPPVAVSGYAGGSATFTVGALGGQLTYQWQLNGVSIPGATNSSLVLSPLGNSESGGVYSVGVTNVVGGTLSAGATLTVVPVNLAHRFSFDVDGSDSVGGVVCNLNGGANITGGVLVLPGGASHRDFGDISGITPTLNANPGITVEGWITPAALQTWAKPWCLGDNSFSERGGNPNSALEFTVQRGDTGLPGLSFSDVSPAPQLNTGAFTPAGWNVGQEYHAVATFDPIANLMRLYVNGAQVAATSLGGQTVSGMNSTIALLGMSFWGDTDFTGSIDELRIYTGPRSAWDILVADSVGPEVVVTNDTLTGVSMMVSTTMLGGSSQQASLLASFVGTPNVPVLQGATNWVSSNTNVVTVNSTGLIIAVGPGTASVSATFAGVTATGLPITISVVKPSIVQAPVPTARYLGGTAQFTVTAVGGQLAYQWSQNGVAIPGATNSSLSVAGVTMAQNNALFSVGITNAAGGIASPAAVLTVLPLPGGYAGSIMGGAPAAYWRLDESAGTTAYDLFGGNNGTYSGSYAFGQPGLIAGDPDTAALFTGGTVTVPYAPVLNNTNFSVEFWALPGDLSGEYVVSLQDRSTGSRIGYAIQKNNFSSAWDFSYGTSPSNYATISGSAPIANGTLYHVVATYDGSNANLYVNGVLAASAATAYQPATPGAANLTIASRNGASALGNGVLDEVAVYPYALTPAQVATDYAYGTEGTTTPPQITTDLPSGATNYVSLSETLSVVAVGTPPLSYQWYTNGTAVAGATNSALTLGHLQLSEDGQTVQVVVSNPVSPTASSSVCTLAVLAAPVPPVMANHWSFGLGATDTVAGVVCYLNGTANISGGSLQMPLPASSHENYGDISGITNTLNSTANLSVELWLTAFGLANWAKPYCFGDPTSVNGNPNSAVEFTLQNGGTGDPSTSMRTPGSSAYDTSASPNPAPWVVGKQYHAVLTYDSVNDLMSVYLNGVLADSAPMGGLAISGLSATTAYLGRSFWGDPDFTGSIKELRIYQSVLDPMRIQANYQTGPNSILAPSMTVGLTRAAANLTLTWPYGRLESAPKLNGPWTGVSGAISPFTTADTTGQVFYRAVYP